MCDVIFAKHHLVQQLVYKRSDQFTDKMSNSDKGFDIFKDTKPYNFEPLAKRVTDSSNCEELAAAHAYMDLNDNPPPEAGYTRHVIVDDNSFPLIILLFRVGLGQVEELLKPFITSVLPVHIHCTIVLSSFRPSKWVLIQSRMQYLDFPFSVKKLLMRQYATAS